MYVCPRCKNELREFKCATCSVEYSVFDGVPDFLSRVGDGSLNSIAQVYDEIYSNHENVWEDQGRDTEFRRAFSELVKKIASGKLLEIGCGEGILLAALQSETKIGIDPSKHALSRAKRLRGADCAVAQAEQLPFGNEEFDVVVAVGVMEHFEDPDKAMNEIFRILRPGGAYIALIHTDLSIFGRVRQKLSEFVFPVPRPLAFLRWVKKKLVKPIHQPNRRSYTSDSCGATMTRANFKVFPAITKKTNPELSLAGAHAVILVAKKSA